MHHKTTAALIAATIVALPACNSHPLKPVEYEGVVVDDGTVAVSINKDVDILFVMDNSGSMGEEQAALAANFERFIGVLEEEGVEANYRIGVTTTDNGNLGCSGTTPEGGKLVMSSCRSRTQDFVFNLDTDATQEACLDICPEQWANIEIQPTTTADDPQARPRPWIENIGGATNLPEGLSTTQAFQCLGPQGISGCGFESHLESMYKALKKAEADGEDSQGFLRDGAILAVVHVTDEADCSVNEANDSAFSGDGSRTFWTDPDALQPTSAVCWNAGVECTGSSSGYDDCHSVDLDVDGNPVPAERADQDAVLRPLSRYTDYLHSFEENKEVLVAVIAGVGNDGEASYAMTTTDPEFQDNFGIGPGCESAAGRAVPPVRLAEFADEFAADDEQNMFSICNDDYSAALQAIAERIRDRLQPSCMEACVADTDPATELLEPLCTLEQTSVDSDGRTNTITIPECNADGSMPSADADVCWLGLVDGLQTTPSDGDMPGDRVMLTDNDTSDDMSPQCAAKGYNLEFDIKRREGQSTPPRTSVNATCELSQQRAIDCPLLP